MNEKFGKLAFYAGVVISILLGWMNLPQATLILVVIGVVVGLLNVTAKESDRFMLSALVLLTGGLTLAAALGEPIKSILHAFIAFTAAAAVVVALRSVYGIEKSR